MPPSRPPGGPSPTEDDAPPGSVRTGVRLVWVVVALNVLSAALLALNLDAVVDGLQEANEGLSRGEVRGALIGEITMQVLVGVVGNAVLATLMRRGVRWSRTVWTILSIVVTIMTLPRVLVPSGGPAVIPLLQVVLVVAAIVLLHRPESRRFFTGESSTGATPT